MKLGVIADTHDNMDAIRKSLNIFDSLNVEMIIHLGDYVAPFTAKHFVNFNKKFIGIFGNNDGEKFGLKKAYSHIGEIYNPPFELEIDSNKILLLHDPFTLKSYIKSQEYDYIFYGHLHEKEKKKVKKTWILNPGEACGILSKKPSIAFIDLKKNIIEIIDLN